MKASPKYRDICQTATLSKHTKKNWQTLSLSDFLSFFCSVRDTDVPPLGIWYSAHVFVCVCPSACTLICWIRAIMEDGGHTLGHKRVDVYWQSLTLVDFQSSQQRVQSPPCHWCLCVMQSQMKSLSPLVKLHNKKKCWCMISLYYIIF